MQGWAPTRLTDLGREQTDQLGAALTEGYDIDRILSSDLYRTEETVEILIEHFDAPVMFESAWRERDIGVHQGLPVDQMSERFPEYDLVEDFKLRYQELKLRWRREYGEDLPKNDEFYPALLRSALNEATIAEELGLE